MGKIWVNQEAQKLFLKGEDDQFGPASKGHIDTGFKWFRDPFARVYEQADHSYRECLTSFTIKEIQIKM